MMAIINDELYDDEDDNDWTASASSPTGASATSRLKQVQLSLAILQTHFAAASRADDEWLRLAVLFIHQLTSSLV